MIEINLDIPESDLAKLRETSTRYVAFLKGNADKSVQKIAVKLALALRASTKGTRQPPRQRPVVKNPLYTSGKAGKSGFSKRDRMKEHISDWYTEVLKQPERDRVKFSDTSARFKAKKAIFRKRKGARIFMPVYDNAKGAAQKSPLREIKKRGLADASWFWMLGRMAGHSRTKPPPAWVKARGTVEGYDPPKLVGNELFATLYNRLNYIRKAFFTAGPTAIRSVLARTETMMRKEMERAEEKARAAAGLS